MNHEPVLILMVVLSLVREQGKLSAIASSENTVSLFVPLLVFKQ